MVTPVKVPGFTNKAWFSGGGSGGAWGSGIWEYDFAADGGGIGNIPLRLASGTAIPADCCILWMAMDLLTALDDGGAGTATIGLTVESSGDIVVADTIVNDDWSTLGITILTINNSIDAFPQRLNGAATPKTTVERTPSIDVAVHALTAGKFVVGFHWMQSVA